MDYDFLRKHGGQGGGLIVKNYQHQIDWRSECIQLRLRHTA